MPGVLENEPVIGTAVTVVLTVHLTQILPTAKVIHI